MAAARRAVSVGIDQCSTRRGTSSTSGFGNLARSPTTVTGAPGRPLVTADIVLSHSTPSVRSRPLPSSHSVFGIEPIASTTRSAGSMAPAGAGPADVAAAGTLAAPAPVPSARITPVTRSSPA